MKIFVTGITGFVGGSVANYFASLGHEVTGIGRSDRLPLHISNKCIYHQADISNPLPDIDADIVIHAAGLASDTAPLKELYTANVQGTQNVLDAAKRIKQFIYISSSSVYQFNKFPMMEIKAGSNVEELSNYGKSKLLAEKLLLGRNRNKITILRPRAIYGRHDQSLLPRLIKLVKGNKLFLPAHLSKNISLTHIDNLIQAIELSIKNQILYYDVFNVADKEVYDLNQVLTTLLPLVTGKRLNTVKIPAWLFELFVALNNKLKLNRSFNRFAASSLTSEATMNIDKICDQLNYRPLKNFYNSYPEIGNWIHQEDGWKTLFNTSPANIRI
jgi:nucleoside-diphosphate-sugar epimerase